MENRCIVCGEIIPEGRQLCPNHEVKRCEFEDIACTRKCIDYNTCVKNPYRYGEQKGR